MPGDAPGSGLLLVVAASKTRASSKRYTPLEDHVIWINLGQLAPWKKRSQEMTDCQKASATYRMNLPQNHSAALPQVSQRPCLVGVQPIVDCHRDSATGLSYHATGLSDRPGPQPRRVLELD
ncbi:hypothetical protein BJY00DRAFT_275473 [Aspergillus carlsbadensis]|nr:hypothetical protein BJY00DRAFT_275473 [Aspergillus carlsbadensis]